MTWRTYMLLFFVGLGITLLISSFQSAAGYMDADYYFANGMQLASGKGFTEPFLWNYLDDPTGLPHPSHSYWMPLASLIASFGIQLSGQVDFSAARWPFILISACLPPVTAALTFSMSSRRDLSLLAGSLAIFTGYYSPFLPTTDTFGISMLLGGLFFLVISQKHTTLMVFSLGIIAGLLHLSRADGVLWLLISVVVIIMTLPKDKPTVFQHVVLKILLLVFSYMLVMGPWFARNLVIYYQPLAPGGIRALFLTRYDELFSYPASRLTFYTWLDSGWQAILSARLWALKLNLSTLLAVQGSVFLFPLVSVGLWQLRGDNRIRIGFLAWLMIFVVMTLLFPYIGARGGYFHSGASLQPLQWAIAPIGLDCFINWGTQRRGWSENLSRQVFHVGLIGIAGLLTTLIILGRVIGPNPAYPLWGEQANRYRAADQLLISSGAPEDTIVMVTNPPGYYNVAGRQAIVIPDGGEKIVMDAAARYGGRYLILESNAIPYGLSGLYENPKGNSSFLYLGMVKEMPIFAIQNP